MLRATSITAANPTAGLKNGLDLLNSHATLEIFTPSLNEDECLTSKFFMCRRVDGETRVGVFAGRNIAAGEELNYDYKYVPGNHLETT